MTTYFRSPLHWFVCLLFVAALTPALWADDAPKPQAEVAPMQPRIVGDWWQVAGDPDLGKLTAKHQQPVDFGIWQAADGTWQLWSCIRYTMEPGKSRLFHRWEGAKLTDTNWKPMGIAMQSDEKLGEPPGGLQAPYVFKKDDLYWMVYGDWVNICTATSKDGKVFERRIQANGKTGMFNEGAGIAPNDPWVIKTGGNNARDPMVIRIGDLWHCYYTANPKEDKGAVRCRTSSDLVNWSEASIVAKGGKPGSNGGSTECPFVVEAAPGQFYLVRTSGYGRPVQGESGHTYVYFSHDPFDFGIDHDAGHYLGALPVAAPEIIKFEGQYYIAALLPDLKGIRIARLEWAASK